MEWVQLAAFAFLLGLVPSGIAATLFELGAGRPIGLDPPFAVSAHPWRTAAALVLAGPFMLANSALTLRRDGRLSAGQGLACAAAAGIWLVAAGLGWALLAASLGGWIELIP